MLKNIRLQIGLVVLFLLTLGLGFMVHNRSQIKHGSWSPIQPQPIFQNTDKLPISLIENQGQIDSRALYYIQSPGHSMYFTKEGHSLRLSQGKGDGMAHTIKVELDGAATERVESLQRSTASVSYFKGPREDWKTIPTHSKIGYIQPWPGIDLAYDGGGGKLESIYTVAPHADPGLIKLRYSGQASLRLDDDGNLIYTT